MTKVCILTVGAEITTGRTQDTNSSFIAQFMTHLGYHVVQMQSVPDVEVDIIEALKESSEKAPLVIMTGGLGPTQDDKTVDALAHFFGCALVMSDEVKGDLIKRYGKEYETIDNQSLVPKIADVLLNPVGTAPALFIEDDDKTVLALPGVPHQVEVLLNLAKDKFPEAAPGFTNTLNFLLLKEHVIDQVVEELHPTFSNVHVGIYPQYGTLDLVLHGHDQKEVDGMTAQFKERFATYLAENALCIALKDLFTEKKKTLALAESCTGGHMASLVTQIPGSSDYFLGSFVTYSNAMKTESLGVLEETLKNHGAVSKETVLEMVEGALERSKSDYAIAVSGVAGPDGGPVGTVWCAIKAKGDDVHTFCLDASRCGARSLIIEYTSKFCLSHLYRFVKFGIQPFSEE